MTFDQLSQIEPRLLQLYDYAVTIKDDRAQASFCANSIWSTEFVPQLRQLVGINAEKEELRAAAAYDVASKAILDVLPPCRNCGCL
jgi:hypothetical protein